MPSFQRVTIIDSHTGGEPTRTVIDGGPPLSGATLAERRADFLDRFDIYRSAIADEPRGSEVIVGALLTEPTNPDCTTGVIFFNNVGYIGMCGHGTIGVVVTLAHLGRIGPGAHHIETPVGIVTAHLHNDGSVSVRNVPAYRYRHGVTVEVEGHGTITGDIAWGGNWFFLSEDHGQTLEASNVGALTDFSWRVRHALERDGITGAEGAEIDHIELSGPSPTEGCDSRNFVLCPGGAYDRSPCGTGTSAKLACLADDGLLETGAEWHQESIIGSVFTGTYVRYGEGNRRIEPTIRGTAFVTAEAKLLIDPNDPFRWGIRGSFTR